MTLGGEAGLLLLGLGYGMQHALEADHAAAVSSLAARQSSVGRIVTHGTAWGLGHMATLMAVAGGALLFGLTLDGTLALWLELLVGLVLIGLGAQVVARLVRDRVHFHRHRHADGTVHFHAHSHRDETAPHDPARHDHDHPRGLPLRSLLVGMVHGLAGSAALFVLTASTAGSLSLGVGYILLFGLGSVIGMAALSALIAVPLAWSSRALSLANGALQGGIGVATVGLGGIIVWSSAAGLS